MVLPSAGFEPTLRPGMTGPFCERSASAWVSFAVVRSALAPRSQTMSSASRPHFAAQKCSPTTATALSILITSTTPGSARARFSSTDRTVPPWVGHALTVAIFIPGTFTSMPNSVAPTTLSGESTRRSGFPMSVNAAGSLSATLAGTAKAPAAFASAPYASLRPDLS